MQKINSLAVVILAAGKGTRMMSLLPKALHAIAGAPLLSWLLRTAETLNPNRIIVVLGPDMPELQKIAVPHITIIQKNRDGTAGATRCAMPALTDFEGNILILLADTPLVTEQTLKNLIDARGTSGFSVLGMAVDNPAGYGRLMQHPDGTLERIVESKDTDPKEKEIQLVNTGVFCVHSAKIKAWLPKITNHNSQKEYRITDLAAIAAAEDAPATIHVTSDPSEVQGCNTRADLALLERTAQQRLRQKFLLEGVSMTDPETVYFYHDTQIENGVMIEPHVFFGESVEIATGAHIRAFSHIEGAKIGRNSKIGPFARLRPGTVIDENVRIGNFVEIKKSDLGARSKINHLAYVGDACVGEDANIGAGSITANYDGFKKYKTVIGARTMIGSNSVLVAPVTIGDDAYVAAGSTVTKDVPSGALAVARATVKTIEGWAAAHRKRRRY